MLWLITQKCNRYLKLSIKSKKIQNQCLYIQKESQNKNNCLSKFFSKKNMVCSYRYFGDIEKQINFHLLIKFAYGSFFVHLMVCFLIPYLLQHPECGEGLLWIAHLIFIAYILTSFIAEFVIFKTLFQKNIRDSLFIKNSKKFTYLIIIVYLILGVLAKGDVYTDIAFLVEVQKCSTQKDGLYGGIVISISSIVFIFTILYQLCLFISLLCKTPTSTICPLTSQTTRLLMCSDNKLLAMVIDKFTVTYYDKFLFWRFPTHKILVFSKLIFEDIIQLIIQMIYLVFEKRENKSLPTILVSLSFTLPCIALSIYILKHDVGSIIDKDDYKEFIDKINIQSNPTEDLEMPRNLNQSTNTNSMKTEEITSEVNESRLENNESRLESNQSNNSFDRENENLENEQNYSDISNSNIEQKMRFERILSPKMIKCQSKPENLNENIETIKFLKTKSTFVSKS